MSERGNTAGRGRLLAVLAFTAAVVGIVPTVSTAAPSREDVRAAREKLETLEHQFETVVERYNHARYLLSENEAELAGAREEMERARAEADAATRRLEERAVDAYTSMGSQLGSILEAGSFEEFSDRLEFMGAISASDADLATEAETARQRAEWAAQRYADKAQESRDRLAEMAETRAEIERLVDEQEAFFGELQEDYRTVLEAQRQAAEEAAAAEAAAAQVSTDAEEAGGDSEAAADTSGGVASPPTSGGTSGGGGGGGQVPPANASAVQIAVRAAYSIVGTRYVWGSSDPSVGLDCSGVTVYAWRQAGVSLPHSAAAQYSMFPRIPLSAVQPGDLVYYGNFGPHIAIYVGGGRIIHASSPAPGGQARIDSMYGYDDPWGAVRVT